jgi:signal transduction histidine kinase
LEIHFNDDGKPKPISIDNSILLFQAIRELLVNVVKHAQANQVWVTMHGNAEMLEITVRDNGVGFDPSAKALRVGTAGGYGLFSIKERIDYAGGSFRIDSVSGKGTRITLGVTLERKEGSSKT